MKKTWRNDRGEFNRHITKQMQIRAKGTELDVLGVEIQTTPCPTYGYPGADDSFFVFIEVGGIGFSGRAFLSTSLQLALLKEIKCSNFVEALFRGAERSFERATGQ